ncbi:MAG: class I SAM-dependent methyltransferase [Rhodococcus sp.]|nr:class I SAM-dependent methyltransferase [Rhodococcus sp. (in: high G+C Gram-positive bacteria)]
MGTDESVGIGGVFDEARVEFERLTATIWSPSAHALTHQLHIRPGETVLDVCCGAGASALPAAAAVGPDGRVHAVDLSDELLECGRLVASDRGLQNIDFVKADATTWEAPSEVHETGYDVLACSYGVFFLPHMDEAFSRLVSLVRPGGRVGVTVWRKGSLEELIDTFTTAVRDVDPPPETDTEAAPPSRDAWAKINTPDGLRDWLLTSGTSAVEVHELSNLVPATPEFVWDLVLGGALRSALTGLDSTQVDAVRVRFLDLLAERAVHTIDAGTLVATAVVRGFGTT